MSVIGDSRSSSLPILCYVCLSPHCSHKDFGHYHWVRKVGQHPYLILGKMFSACLCLVKCCLWRIFFWNVLYLFLISSMTLGFSFWTIAFVFSSRTVCQAFAQWLMRPTSLNKNRATSGESIGFLNLGQCFQMQNTAQLQPPAFIDKQQDDLLCQKEAEKIPFLVECWVWNQVFLCSPSKQQSTKMSPVDTNDRPEEYKLPLWPSQMFKQLVLLLSQTKCYKYMLRNFPLRCRNPPSHVMLPTGRLHSPQSLGFKKPALLTPLSAISGWTEVISLNSFPGGTSISPNGDHHRTARFCEAFRPLPLLSLTPNFF